MAESEIMWDKECYKITFDEGTEIIAAGEHQWAVTTHVDYERHNTRLRILTTKEMLDSGLYVHGGKNDKTKYRIPVAKPLQYEQKELPIHPYLLGYWLGDGSRGSGTITTADIEVINRIRSLGYIVNKSSELEHQYGWYVRGIVGYLRDLGLLNSSKRIPELYLQASFDQRLELLRGLMDSDGTIEERGVTSFCNTECSLVDDVSFLLRSLGYKHGVSRVKPQENGVAKYELEYRLTFTPIPEYPVFHLPRKQVRAKARRNARNDWYFVKAIEPAGKLPVKCIKVQSSSHLFLVGKSLVPTHNSSALLAAALQYVDIPGYSAILFRRTFGDLTLPGALMDRARKWLSPYQLAGEVRWVDKEKSWVFPSTARLAFGYLEHENDKYRYQSAEFQFVGFDELTQFTETQYRYLFSRLRRLKGSKIPIRMRSASNPGGLGHEWVAKRFIDEGVSKGRIFIPAKLEDNPHLDINEYEMSLAELDPVTRAQLRDGNWKIKAAGNLFKRHWFSYVGAAPRVRRLVRYWDFASTEPHKKNQSPDFTVGLLLGEIRGLYYVMDVRRFQARPYELERIVRQVAELDGKGVNIWIEQEPGSSGVLTVDSFARGILKGYAVRGNRATGSKVLRANPASAAVEGGRVFLVRGPWNEDFIEEAELFPGGFHDDQVDAFSGAFEVIGSSPVFDALPISVGSGYSYWADAI